MGDHRAERRCGHEDAQGEAAVRRPEPLQDQLDPRRVVAAREHADAGLEGDSDGGRGSLTEKDHETARCEQRGGEDGTPPDPVRENTSAGIGDDVADAIARGEDTQPGQRNAEVLAHPDRSGPPRRAVCCRHRERRPRQQQHNPSAGPRSSRGEIHYQSLRFREQPATASREDGKVIRSDHLLIPVTSLLGRACRSSQAQRPRVPADRPLGRGQRSSRAVEYVR